MSKSSISRATTAAKKLLGGFPEYYDALRDPLANRSEHAATVNELLKTLRNLVRELRP
jgi:hypothetical protein